MSDKAMMHGSVNYGGFENGTAGVFTTGCAPLRFRGKVSFWWYALSVLMLICTCCFLTAGIVSIVTSFPVAIIFIFSAGVFLPLDFYMIDSCVRNYVDLDAGFLKIRISVFSGTIQYSAISYIKETNSMKASFSPSLDRLQIRYMNNKEILIAVKDKEGFLSEIHRRNPFIYIERKGR